MKPTTDELIKDLKENDTFVNKDYMLFATVNRLKGRLDVLEVMKKSRGINKNIRKFVNKQLNQIKSALGDD